MLRLTCLNILLYNAYIHNIYMLLCFEKHNLHRLTHLHKQNLVCANETSLNEAIELINLEGYSLTPDATILMVANIDKSLLSL